FKQDGAGYLREIRRHIYVFDIEKKSTEQITSGPFDDGSPVWSPDGKWLAFVSNRTPEPDSNFNTDIFVVEARPGQTPRQLTTWEGSDSSPAFSPDGQTIAYVAGGNPKDIWYATNRIAAIPFQGGTSKPLTGDLDRNVSDPQFTPDGKHVLFALEDGGNDHLARVPVAGGAVERLIAGERVIQTYDVGTGGEIVVLESVTARPGEISVWRDGSLKKITAVNDEFLKGIRLGKVERFKARSADGTMIDGFLTRPPDAAPGRLPTILRIHGGPVSQFSTGFSQEWQILAAHGYAVVAANPRGSSGYGQAFSRALFADWGNKDFQDVMAAVDHVIAMGVADPEKLGVGGWSYGGILTNYVITQTDRFRAAISGASEVNYLANYGTDHYQRQWEAELGLPWKNTDLWIKLSPWYKVEKIVTPTLIMCGERDMNVPLLNSEQLYQALRRLGRETELVIYPGQTHGIRVPSYQKDRYERYLAWYDRYLKTPAPAVTGISEGQKAEATSLLGVPLYSPKPSGAAAKTLEDNLAKATADYIKNPDAADNIIWLGRRQAYLGRYRDAIDVFTRGIEKFPKDFRLLRHRGHRHITVREFAKAIADLEQAAKLIQGVPDQPEPDGAPNPQNVPTSTSHFNIWYHLGLAYYLNGDFENALRSYRECMKYSQASEDRLVATSDWLYMTLRRLKRNDEAARVLEPIHPGMKIIENQAYWERLLMYKGLKKPEELLRNQDDSTAIATYGYGVANWYLYNGETERAAGLFRKILRGAGWAAFGYIAAEADVARSGSR
ncbi:MAG: tetratricopeptide repeat protein, partial [Acidobacteria bacterium]|nr:tetratricopeptide repeat protein [Acidobacteriota bacterium]